MGISLAAIFHEITANDTLADDKCTITIPSNFSECLNGRVRSKYTLAMNTKFQIKSIQNEMI